MIMKARFGVRGAGFGALAIAAALAATLSAQTRGRHPVSGRVYAGVMSAEGAAWLERPERQAEENPQLAIQILALPAGAVAADIGAGSGYITELLSKAVGPTGRVYGVDIQPKMIELLRQRMAEHHLTNITPVLSEVADPKLPDNTLDLAIMVDVYHEMSEPQTMLQHLRQALKADGRLVLLEYRKEDPSIPILPDHKMSVAEAKLEVEHEGFTLADVNESLPRQHILIFTKR
jgi:SAM-dependent methyltransferase